MAVSDKGVSRITPKWGQFLLAELKSDGHAADASFIVDAVNAHDELIAALKRIARTDLNTFGGDAKRFEEWLHGFCAETISKVPGEGG